MCHRTVPIIYDPNDTPLSDVLDRLGLRLEPSDLPRNRDLVGVDGRLLAIGDTEHVWSYLKLRGLVVPVEASSC